MPLTLNSTGVVVIDDSDPRIIYQGTWLTAGVREEYNFTTHGSNTLGSTATLLFNGTSVTVYGTIGYRDAVSTYSLDDSSPVTLNLVGVSVPIHQTVFYQSPDLQDGSHRLVITSLNSGDNTLYIDYFLYLPSPTPSTTATTSTPVVTVTASTTSSASPSAINVGAIAGGVVGGVLLFAILVTLLFFWRRRSPSKNNYLQGNPPLSGVDPFPVFQPQDLYDQSSQPSSKTLRMHTANPSDSTRPSLGDARPRNETDQSPSGSRSYSGTRYTPVPTEPPLNTVHVTHPNDSSYSSSTVLPLHVDARTQNSNIGQLGSHSDIRVHHQDGGMRIAGGSPQMQRPFSPSRDIPPAYDRY